MRFVGAVVLVLASGPVYAQGMPPPIIDMHLHALPLADFERLVGPAPIPHCVPMTDLPVPESRRRWAEVFRSREPPCQATSSPSADDEVMEKTLEIMKRHNVIGGASGARVVRWKEAAPERIFPSLSFSGGPDAPSVGAVRKSFEKEGFAVFGEVTTQYAGMAPDDPSLEPYWTLLEELGIPVGVDIGTGPVGAPGVGFERYRARLHSPLLLEEVLLRHPDLRIYIMHAGWPMLDDLLAVLWTYPQVYIDVGAISWALPARNSTGTCGGSWRLASASGSSSAPTRWSGPKRWRWRSKASSRPHF